MSHSGSLDDFLRTHDNRPHREQRRAVPRVVDNDPTGWGPLPQEPTEKDRASNKGYDELYGDLRDQYWETVPHPNDFGDTHDENGEPYTKEQLRNPDERAWYEYRQEMIDNYDAAFEWQNTRIPKRQYDERVQELEQHGLGEVRLTPQVGDDGWFYSLKVDFPPDFRHLTNQATQQKKLATPENYHISLTYRRQLEQNEAHRAQMNAFLKEYFGMNNGIEDIGKVPGKTFILPNISVSKSGGIYQLTGGRKFEDDLYALTKIGTGRDGLPHISLT